MSIKKYNKILIIILVLASFNLSCSREYRINYFMNRGFTQDEAERIIEKKLRIGDSKEMVQRVRSSPTNKSRRRSKYGVTETWWWSSYNKSSSAHNFITFFNGKITNIGYY